MIQDTRKDPRAKVLSMTVRYKSATIDEFIEHHSHDVSRGGMFIKTPSPFPPGTLLKFEVRIADEQKVMQGVGRVVWKREASSAAVDSPSGMGVKFIKLDDDSKGIIDRLVGRRGNAEGAFDAGERTSAPGAATPAAGTPAVERPMPVRKGTMIGLGAVKIPDAAPKAGGAAFFPNTEPENVPAPEDRTVMRQAAELLRDALREAGGSMDEIGGAAGTAPVVAAPEPKVVTEEKKAAAAAAAAETPMPGAPRTPEKKAEAAPQSARAAVAPASVKPAARPLSEPPRDSMPATKPGGSKAVWMLLAVAVLGGGIFFLTQRNKPTEELPPMPTAPAEPPAAVQPPPPVESAVAPPTEPSASAEPSAAASASAAPAETPAEKAAREKTEAAAAKAEAEAAKKAEADAKKAADLDAKKAAADAKKAELDAKKAADAEARSAARAAAAARAATVMKTATPASPAPPPETPPATPGTTATAPAATPKPAAPKPAAPKPAVKPSESDNPY